MVQGRNFQKKSSNVAVDNNYRDFDAEISARINSFQSEYGELIYNYPLRYLKMDSDKAGDFYLYVFENNRIFKRLKHFRGEHISLATYLKYYVLKDMCMEWLKATSSKLSIELLDDPDNSLKYEIPEDDDNQPKEKSPWLDCVLRVFRQPAFLILRILHLVDFPVLAEDIRQIALKTGRELKDVVQWIAKAEHLLSGKVTAGDARSDQLAILYWRRLMYQKRLVQIEDELLAARFNNQMTLIQALGNEKQELERKYAWRLRQTEIFITDAPNQATTMTYKDIAELMMTTIGSVSAKIHKSKARLKSEIIRMCGKKAAC